ncbi:MAG: sigma-54-dependent Fis family transcriptional regulator [Deltaproteobacteria bacterium]|nr:sigma-54-dependent Fis family transcriptional regulator [Deltaproteobacteria bacterium]
MDAAASSQWIRAMLRYRSDHPALLHVLDTLERLLDRPYRTNVVLLGEAGTGKEGLARALHAAMSAGADSPFVEVRSGSRDPAALAHELFGAGDRPGAAERAHRGTLYLDEVATLAPEIQARLADLLHGTVEREGDLEPRSVDLRIVASTDHDLRGLVASGRFRHDLFHRLARIELLIPPLRERRADIPRTALWIGNRILERAGVRARLVLEGDDHDDSGELRPIELTADAAAFLAAQPWPGNFRGLEITLERALLLYLDGDRLDPPTLLLAGDRIDVPNPSESGRS